MIGTAQLATELALSSEEFNEYHIASVPASIGFQLKEFTVSVSFADQKCRSHGFRQQATVTYADSMGLAILLRFTEPGNPIVIVLETDDTKCLFAISTTFDSVKIFPTPQSRRSTTSATPQRASLKRAREDANSEAGPAPGSSKSASPAVPHISRRKPLKVVQRQDVTAGHKPSPIANSVTSSQSVWDSKSMPPPPSVPLHGSPTVPFSPVKQEEEEYGPPEEEPLFLHSSQLTQQDIEIVKKETANMTEEELAEILQFDEDELEELTDRDPEIGDSEMVDVSEIAATQSNHSNGKVGFSFGEGRPLFNYCQVFHPLFED